MASAGGVLFQAELGGDLEVGEVLVVSQAENLPVDGLHALQCLLHQGPVLLALEGMGG